VHTNSLDRRTNVSKGERALACLAAVVMGTRLFLRGLSRRWCTVGDPPEAAFRFVVFVFLHVLAEEQARERKNIWINRRH